MTKARHWDRPVEREPWRFGKEESRKHAGAKAKVKENSLVVWQYLGST